MHRELPFAVIALFASLAATQQPDPSTSQAGATAPPQANGAAPRSDAPSAPYRAAGHVSAPVVLHMVNAEFTDEARRAKYQGVCLISLIVDAQGNPQNVHVVRTLGMGLDEKAMEAIRQYRFKPAMKDGTTPVPVMITIEVDFRLYDGRKKPRIPAHIPALVPAGSGIPSGKLIPPTLLDYTEPKYSRSARKNRVAGECVIGLSIDAYGIPQNVRVVRSLEPSLDANAVAAVKRWRYSPTKLINGTNVPFEATVTIEFNLPG